MPIRPEERARYPRNWRAISLRIRERDGNACKWCGAPNGVEIKRLIADAAQWLTVSAFVKKLLLAGDYFDELALAQSYHRPVRVVLTVAHLDHTPEHCDDDNLVALCQRCHLTYDAKHHAKNAAETRARRRDESSGHASLFARSA